MSKRLKVGETGTVMIADVDAKSIVTRDLSDERRSQQAIEEYGAAYAEGVKLPPVAVYLVDGVMVLVDGWHRWRARTGLDELGIVARCVGEGSMDDALRYALCTTNVAHGLRLSPADCEHRVCQALDSGLWDSSPASTIAADLGINRRTVSKYMEAWEATAGRELPPTVCDGSGREQPRRKPRQGDVVQCTTPTEPGAGTPLDDDWAPPPKKKGKPPPMPRYGPALLFTAKAIARTRIDARKELGDIAPLSVCQRVEAGLKEVEGLLRLAVPTECSGCGGKGCKACAHQGWGAAKDMAR